MNWINNRTEMDIVVSIKDRAVNMGLCEKLGRDRVSLMMDIEATHANGCPLDLLRLLDFPEADFAHDVAGIVAHINRTNGKLEDCFVPRCARTQ